jgi:hypothetical protein
MLVRFKQKNSADGESNNIARKKISEHTPTGFASPNYYVAGYPIRYSVKHEWGV